MKRRDLSALAGTRTGLLGIAALLAPVQPWAAVAVIAGAIALEITREIRKPKAEKAEPDDQ